MLTAFATVGQTVSALMDDTVERENSLLVQRYISSRREWFKWAWTGFKDLAQRPMDVFKNYGSEFIQTSRRYAPIRSRQVFMENISRREMAPETRRRLIWFDVQHPERMPSRNGLESKTRAKNIHYPPGMVFSYNGDLHVVVDDIGTMYRYEDERTDPIYTLKNTADGRFRDYFEEEPVIDSWKEWAQIKSIKIGDKAGIINVRKQFRIAFNVETQDVVLVSVAGKNFAQSIRDTIVLTSASIFALSSSDTTFRHLGQKTLYQTMAAVSGIENQQFIVPLATAAVVSKAIGPDEENLTEVIPLQFFAQLTSLAAAQFVNKWIIPKPTPVSQEDINGLMSGSYRGGEERAFSLLVPLSLTSTRIGNGREVWGGKLWDPISGRIHQFTNSVTPYQGVDTLKRWAAINEEGVKIFYNSQSSDNAQSLTNQIEDGFEIELEGDGLKLRFFTLNRASVIATYRHINSPLAEHLWFVKC
jgi:hypothetical protein